MASKLDALKAQFAQKAGGNYDDTWKKFYSFWKMPDDTTAVVRFLPDLDPDNPMGFLVENLVHELVINGDKKKVPCAEMYGEKCPICELSRQYYAEAKEAETNGDSASKLRLESLGKKYYRKKSYIGQVLVIESPIEHDQAQLVKLIDFGPKIFKGIQAAFQSGDLEEAPYEFVGGYNFRIKKTKAGQYADYGTSTFAPKQTNVDDSIIAQLDLYNLKEWRQKYIDNSTLQAMLLADQTGTPMAATESSTTAAVQALPTQTAPVVQAPVVQAPVVQAPVVQAPVVQAEAAPAPATAPSGKAASVLDQLRARAAAKKAEASV